MTDTPPNVDEAIASLIFDKLEEHGGYLTKTDLVAAIAAKRKELEPKSAYKDEDVARLLAESHALIQAVINDQRKGQSFSPQVTGPGGGVYMLLTHNFKMEFK